MTGPQGGDDPSRGCSSHAEKKAARSAAMFRGGDTPVANDKAPSAGDTEAARMTMPHGGDDPSRGCSSHAEKKAVRSAAMLGGDDSGLWSQAANTSETRTAALGALRRTALFGGAGYTKAARTVAYRDEHTAAAALGGLRRTTVFGGAGYTSATSTVAYRDEDAAASGNLSRRAPVPVSGVGQRGLYGDTKKRKAQGGAEVPALIGGGSAGFGGDHSARGCSRYADNEAAGRTVAYGGEEIFRQAAASGALPSQQDTQDDSKSPGKKYSVAHAAAGVKKSRSSNAQVAASPAEGNVQSPMKRRFIDVYDMTVANKNAMAAIGGEMPRMLRLAAEIEAFKAAAPRMEAMSRKEQRQQQPQPQPQTNAKPQPHTDAEPQPHTDAEPFERRPLLQPDRSCPRCHTSTGTVAPHHLCRCTRCLKTADLCPFCCLAALPKIEVPRGMCPSCGRRPGKLALDHVCSCDTCIGCSLCELAKLPRPLPRFGGACPCCLQNAGNASSHLCLCLKCKLVPGSQCPFCALSEPPSPINPFDSIRLIAYSLK